MASVASSLEKPLGGAVVEVDDARSLGEGACWCPITNKLLWIDVTRGKVFVYDPETKENKHLDMRQPVGTVVPHTTTTVVAALLKGIAVVDVESGKIERHFPNPESDLINNRWNDGKCDPQGRLWVGSMGFNCEANAGHLYSFTSEGNTRTINSTISNGICWSKDGATMFWIDTPTGAVDAFDFNGTSGEISNRRQCIKIPEGTGFPDGSTIDSEGMIWVAQWEGWRVSRYNPSTGEHLVSYALPCAQVTSCAFGGANLDQLFITTASCGLSEESLAAQPHAGKLFRLDLSETGIKGVPAVAFKE